jgi:hypothetical protein
MNKYPNNKKSLALTSFNHLQTPYRAAYSPTYHQHTCVLLDDRTEWVRFVHLGPITMLPCCCRAWLPPLTPAWDRLDRPWAVTVLSCIVCSEWPLSMPNNHARDGWLLDWHVDRQAANWPPLCYPILLHGTAQHYCWLTGPSILWPRNTTICSPTTDPCTIVSYPWTPWCNPKFQEYVQWVHKLPWSHNCCDQTCWCQSIFWSWMA